MNKEFNTTGTCYPEQHYMMDNSGKLSEILELIKKGKYFTINRPRQYGKTTSMFRLADQLRVTDTYMPINMSFQGIDEKWHESDGNFAQMFVNQLERKLEFTHPDLFEFIEKNRSAVKEMDDLSRLITRLVHRAKKELVLFIDEVDASSNYEPFLKFLAMLRTKYLARDQADEATFHSIVLAGVHDIKSLKFKLRNPEQADYNSPWNIAVDFEVRMSFNPQEIAPMLEEYSTAEDVKMDVLAIAERLYYHTSGYPFLVSKLCKNIADKVYPKKEDSTWTVEDVDAAVRILLMENNTNFDSLIKNLENNSDLFDLVYRVLIEAERIAFNPDEPVIQKGRMYGVFKRNGHLQIHNRVYEQRIYNYMTIKKIIEIPRKLNFTNHFMTDDNGLDMKAALLRFQQFMKEDYSEKSLDFLEREGRTIFLAFLTPILNGHGYSFKEVQVSLEKRLDIVVTYFQHRYIIELKKWYGNEYHQKGLLQLADYLDIHGVEEGFLVVFDDRKEKEWRTEEVVVEGKKVFGVWV
ncbi:MAG: AAA-like domain-containing protein [Bacteroidota bacterium]